MMKMQEHWEHEKCIAWDLLQDGWITEAEYHARIVAIEAEEEKYYREDWANDQ
jgi:hypothetical protein